jgi:hypothetical protein
VRAGGVSVIFLETAGDPSFLEILAGSDKHPPIIQLLYMYQVINAFLLGSPFLFSAISDRV